MAVAFLFGAVSVVDAPVVGLTVPSEVVQITVPGAPQAVKSTSSPTPIVVLDRLVGVVNTQA